jgi:mono/diheme cytochrome c family protein
MSGKAIVKIFFAGIPLSMLMGLAACTGQHSSPNWTYMPDMHWGPAIRAQDPGVRLPVKGTIPRGFTPDAYQGNPEGAGRELKNPLKRTEAVLTRGQDRYNIYCIVCHGPTGEGDGSVIGKFPRPPSLQSDKVIAWADGNIYHVITHGQNLMPSYASQVSQADRWAIIHYIRAIQRAKHPTAEDVKAAEQE